MKQFCFLLFLTKHDADNFFVRFAHTFASQNANVFDGVFYTLYNETLAGIEFMSVLVHHETEQTGIHGRGDLGGTAGFGSVADDAGVHSEGIDNGMCDRIVSAAVEEGNSCCGADAGTDNAAIGGERADAGF